MKALFDQVSYRTSEYLTNAYSTSFSRGISLLGKSIQPKIYAIYGFVRLADEIVDSFESYPQEQLLDRLIVDYNDALKQKISLNPILNAFQEVVLQYQLDDLVNSFLESMKMDLSKNDYTTTEQYQKYIYGSAEVVGLMCLKVFVNNNQGEYEQLRPYAIQLGSAFQKINFLRDIKDDLSRLGRSYFPNVDWDAFTDKEKNEILQEIKLEFDQAEIGIKKLPDNCKLGVYVAYNYYLGLWRKLASKSPSEILTQRTRVPNWHKMYILYKSFIKLQLGLI